MPLPQASPRPVPAALPAPAATANRGRRPGAARQDVPVRIKSPAPSRRSMVDLRAQVTSTIAQVLVKDGQMVRKGELLFRFDDRADRAQLDKAPPS